MAPAAAFPSPASASNPSGPGATPLKPSASAAPSTPPPAVAMQSPTPHSETGSAEARIGGTVVSGDWLGKKKLADSIRKSIKEGIMTAMRDDPELKELHTTLKIEKIGLSTAENRSTTLKGLKITTDDKKIDFTATPESVSGNGNPENLRAMSIAIVKNLETRIANGETNLKINLGGLPTRNCKR